MTWPPKPGVASAKPKRRNNHDEDDLQESVVAFLDLALPAQAGVFWSSTLNGVRVTKKAITRLHKLGLRKGVLDLVFIPLEGPLKGQTHWVELKTATGRPTPEQKKIVEALGPDRACFARSVVEVQDALLRWGFILRARV
jgi:hypothetical protein